MGDFKNRQVWQKANALAIATVRAFEGVNGSAGSFLRNQCLRAVFSIQANLAEGSAKQSDREFARYTRIALGSATETENHLILANDLGLIEGSDFDRLNSQVHDIRKMLTGLIKRLATAKST